MVSPPFRVVLGCPSCHGSFVTHLFFSDFPGEPHALGGCPWCGHRGTVQTGTVAEPATFSMSSRTAGSFEHAIAGRCRACGRFRVDGRCARCAPSLSDVRVHYTGEQNELAIERDQATVREPSHRPAAAILRAFVDPTRVARIAACVVEGAKVPHEIAFVPDEHPAGVTVVVGGVKTSVALTVHSVREVPALWEASMMLLALCGHIRRGVVVAQPPLVPEPEPVMTSQVIPPEECVTCEVDSPFTGRVDDRNGELYAFYRCPSCRCEFSAFIRALQPALRAWLASST